jgi:hypothetical protein
VESEYANPNRTDRQSLAKALKKLYQHQIPNLDHPAIKQFKTAWSQMIT